MKSINSVLQRTVAIILMIAFFSQTGVIASAQMKALPVVPNTTEITNETISTNTSILLEYKVETVNSIRLEWHHAIVIPTKVEYLVYRNGVFICNTSNNYYVDNDLLPETDYVYYVVASTNSQTNKVSAVTPGNDVSLTSNEVVINLMPCTHPEIQFYPAVPPGPNLCGKNKCNECNNFINTVTTHYFSAYSNGKRKCTVCSYEEACAHSSFMKANEGYHSCNTCGITYTHTWNGNTCTGCGWSKTCVNHSFEVVNGGGTAVLCQRRVCQVCKKEDNITTHGFGAWSSGGRSCGVCGYREVCSNHTLATSGENHYCSTCGIPLNHSYGNEVGGYKRCNHCPNTTYVGHSWQNDGASHHCSTCGTSGSHSFTNYGGGHSCSACGYSSGHNLTNNGSGHSCSACGYSSGHNFSNWSGNTRTCNSCGFQETCNHTLATSGENHYCSTCGIPFNHSYGSEVGGYKRCNYCPNTIYVGHSWQSDGASHHCSTCGASGGHNLTNYGGGHSCSVCGYSSGHNFSNWSGNTRTCGSCGYQEICNHTNIVMVDKNSHKCSQCNMITAHNFGGIVNYGKRCSVCSWTLQDTDLPTKPSLDLDKDILVKGHSIILRWLPSSDDNGIQNYHVKYTRAGKPEEMITSGTEMLIDGDKNSYVPVEIYSVDTFNKESQRVSLMIQTEDYSDEISGAEEIFIDRPVSGNIYGLRDIDLVKFIPAKTGEYTIFTQGATDTFGSLFTGNGLIKENDDMYSDFNFHINSVLEQGTTYYLAINGSGGEYILYVTNTIPVQQVYNNAPIVLRSNLPSGKIFSENTAGFIPSIDVSDIDNDALTCKAYIDNETSPRSIKSVTNTTSEKTVLFDMFEFAQLTNGNHSLRFEVSDGTYVVNFVSEVKVDKLPPNFGSYVVTSTETQVNCNIETEPTDDVAMLDASPYRYTLNGTTSEWTVSKSYQFSSLNPNTEYKFVFEVKDKAGHIAREDSYICTKAQQPTIIVENTEKDSIQLLISDSNSMDTQYQIMVDNKFVAKNGMLSDSQKWINLKEKRILIQNLLPNSSYVISVIARNNRGVETNKTSINLSTKN